MKLSQKLLIVIVLAFCAFAPLREVKAQTATNSPTPPQNFFQTAEDYFITANTNYTWEGNSLSLSAGADYLNGINYASYVRGIYSLRSLDTNSVILDRAGIEAKMRNTAIAGTIQSAEGGINYALIRYYSVQLSASLIGGYGKNPVNNNSSGMIEPELGVQDKATPNTFFGIWISEPIWFRGVANKIPDIGIETGFTY